jgi:uncharacterized MAPEG superfamily protein
MVPHSYAIKLAGKNYDLREVGLAPSRNPKSTKLAGTDYLCPSPAGLKSTAPKTPPWTRRYVIYLLTGNPLSVLSSHIDITKKKTLRRISRAKAATANGFETLGLYAAAVVAGNVAGVATERMNQLTLGYLLSRVVYIYTYVRLQDNARLAPLRPLVWLAGVGIVTTLYVLAGKALN